MPWTQILSAGAKTSDKFSPGTPFALKVEPTSDDAPVLILQCKREDSDADWSAGEMLPQGEIIPCYGCPDTDYRVVSDINAVNIFYNIVMTSQADRK